MSLYRTNTNCHFKKEIAVVYKLELDGIIIGNLGNGGTHEFALPAGSHILKFIYGRRCMKTVMLNIAENTEALHINVRINAGGLDVQSDSAGCVTVAANEKKPNGCSIGCLTIIIIIAVTTIISSIIGSDSSDTRTDTSAVSQNSELSDNEKAANLLESATDYFDRDRYAKAISLCKKICADYPDTDVSGNMTAYPAEQYAKFPEVSAVNLMSEYSSNSVDADMSYDCKTIIVSGIVSSIGKTNSKSILCVVLKTNTMLFGVQLNFKPENEADVADLCKGAKVKAIGTCSGRSGLLPVLADATNVMIDDCILIN